MNRQHLFNHLNSVSPHFAAGFDSCVRTYPSRLLSEFRSSAPQAVCMCARSPAPVWFSGPDSACFKNPVPRPDVGPQVSPHCDSAFRERGDCIGTGFCDIRRLGTASNHSVTMERMTTHRARSKSISPTLKPISRSGPATLLMRQEETPVCVLEVPTHRLAQLDFGAAPEWRGVRRLATP